jgi:hypothetical protein
MTMRRLLAALPVLLATFVAGCHVTIVAHPGTPGEAADSLAAGDDADDTGAVHPLPVRRPIAAPEIVILGPEPWTGAEAGTLAVPVRQPVTLTGEVRYRAGVDSVLVNGRPATMGTARDGATPFEAIIEPTAPGLMDVRVEAWTPRGTAVAVRHLDAAARVASPRPARPTPPAPGASDTTAVPPRRPPTPGEPPALPPTTPPETPPEVPPGVWPETPPVPVSAADSAWAQRARWAVIIGVGAYADDAVPTRAAAAADARAFRDFLRSPAAGPGGVPATHRRVLLDRTATRASIQAALTDYLAGVGPDDVVLAFLAGTALPDPARPNGAYFLPYDARADDLAGTALTVQWLTDALRDVGAHQKIVLADILQAPGDARGGGRVGGQPPGRAGQGQGQGAGAAQGQGPGAGQNLVHRALESAGPRDRSLVVLTAAGPASGPALEGQAWGGLGAFMYHVLGGLTGAADADDNGVVTLTELIGHTRDAVRQATSGAQVPGLSAASYDRHWPMAVVPLR